MKKILKALFVSILWAVSSFAAQAHLVILADKGIQLDEEMRIYPQILLVKTGKTALDEDLYDVISVDLDESDRVPQIKDVGYYFHKMIEKLASKFNKLTNNNYRKSNDDFSLENFYSYGDNYKKFLEKFKYYDSYPSQFYFMWKIPYQEANKLGDKLKWGFLEDYRKRKGYISEFTTLPGVTENNELHQRIKAYLETILEPEERQAELKAVAAQPQPPQNVDWSHIYFGDNENVIPREAIYFSNDPKYGDFPQLANSYIIEYKNTATGRSEPVKITIDSKKYDSIDQYINSLNLTNYQEKLNSMLTALRAKFTDKDISNYIKLTDDQKRAQRSGVGPFRPLIYESDDSFWGTGKDYKGQNHLGQLIMHVQNEIDTNKASLYKPESAQFYFNRYFNELNDTGHQTIILQRITERSQKAEEEKKKPKPALQTPPQDLTAKLSQLSVELEALSARL